MSRRPCIEVGLTRPEDEAEEIQWEEYQEALRRMRKRRIVRCLRGCCDLLHCRPRSLGNFLCGCGSNPECKTCDGRAGFGGCPACGGGCRCCCGLRCCGCGVVGADEAPAGDDDERRARRFRNNNSNRVAPHEASVATQLALVRTHPRSPTFTLSLIHI